MIARMTVAVMLACVAPAGAGAGEVIGMFPGAGEVIGISPA